MQTLDQNLKRMKWQFQVSMDTKSAFFVHNINVPVRIKVVFVSNIKLVYKTKSKQFANNLKLFHSEYKVLFFFCMRLRKFNIRYLNRFEHLFTISFMLFLPHSFACLLFFFSNFFFMQKKNLANRAVSHSHSVN